MVIGYGISRFEVAIVEGSPLSVVDQPPDPAVPGPTFSGLKSTLIVDGLGALTDVTGLPGSDVMLVTEKIGRVRAVVDGELRSQPFLDLTDVVGSQGNEQGLLTIELHPQFAENRRLFLFYTDRRGHSQLIEATADQDDQTVSDSEDPRHILEIPQQHQYHQSGSIAFGPNGLLWLSVGDGGRTGDPDKRGQDPTNLYGTIIRIDVDSAEHYQIPSTNPYVGSSGDEQPEIWSYGLRNPWRISIDPLTGTVYVPDVGQELVEEINVIPWTDTGYNFGWSITEGSYCFEASSCDIDGQTMPVFEYRHDGYGCAVVGGEVYRGEAIPELQGHYFYADYCFGWVESQAFQNGEMTMKMDWREDLGRIGSISSFGTDSDGELYVTNLQGEVWRIDRADAG
jgi:hypothetical protein